MAVPHSATDDEIVTAVFLLITEIESHERAEWFQYKGEEHFPAHPGDELEYAAPPFGFALPAESWATVNPQRAAIIRGDDEAARALAGTP